MGIELKKQAATVVLTKRGLTSPPGAQVGLAIDISGSMNDEYRDGIVQDVVERCLALAMSFDLDKKLDVWTFDNGADYIGSVNEGQIDGFVHRDIMNNGKISKWGGTSYGPVLSIIDKFFFGSSSGLFGMFAKKPSKDPVFIMFITDGENSDTAKFQAILRDFRSKNIYIQIVGIGNANLSYVKQIADAEPNVGFCQIADVRKLSDEQMMEQLVQTEFVEWIKKF